MAAMKPISLRLKTRSRGTGHFHGIALALLPKSTTQCRSVLTTSAGAVFCVKHQGHEGDHRGYRAQWNDVGRVPITEKAL